MDNNGRTRAVVTGMGVLSCLGKSVDEYWDGLTSGRSGIAELTLTDTSGYPCKIGGEVRTSIQPNTSTARSRVGWRAFHSLRSAR